MCALAPSLPLLVLARVIQGAGGAMLALASRQILMQAYDKNRLLGMMNFVVMPALLGPEIGRAHV